MSRLESGSKATLVAAVAALGCAPVDRLDVAEGISVVATLTMDGERILSSSSLLRVDDPLHLDAHTEALVLAWTDEQLAYLARLDEPPQDPLRVALDCEPPLPRPRAAFRYVDGEFEPYEPARLPPITTDDLARRCPCAGVPTRADFIEHPIHLPPEPNTPIVVKDMEPAGLDAVVVIVEIGSSTTTKQAWLVVDDILVERFPIQEVPRQVLVSSDGEIWLVQSDGVWRLDKPAEHVASDPNLALLGSHGWARADANVVALDDEGERSGLRGTSIDRLPCSNVGTPSIVQWQSSWNFALRFNYGMEICWVRGGASTTVSTSEQSIVRHSPLGLVITDRSAVTVLDHSTGESTRWYEVPESFGHEVIYALAGWGDGLMIHNSFEEMFWVGPDHAKRVIREGAGDRIVAVPMGLFVERFSAQSISFLRRTNCDSTAW